MTESSEPEEKEATGEGAISEEEIDATLEESFPASDPSQWTLGVGPHTAPEVKPEEKVESQDEGPLSPK
jgi:hypothetical protein